MQFSNRKKKYIFYLQYSASEHWPAAAPLKMVTVRDAIYDLPSLTAGNSTDKIKYLGMQIDTLSCKLSITENKKANLLKLLNIFLEKSHCTILELSKLIGKLIATCPAIKYGWLYTKVMEKEKIRALRKNSGKYNRKMQISEQIKKDIEWWIKKIPNASKFFEYESFKYEIFTDASPTGWGAVEAKNKIFGSWDDKVNGEHINYKELYAVKYALIRLADKMKNCKILLRIDNKTAISYVNKMGGVRHRKYNDLARSIWQWAEDRNIELKANYICSRDNKEADALSRINSQDIEWELEQTAYQKIVDKFGKPDIDLFASTQNKKCSRYISWFPDPLAFSIDAFTIDWGIYFFYAFPPFILIPNVLQKIKNDNAQGILVVPLWKNQPWYPLFCEMTISDIIILGPNKNLLLSACRKIHHPSSAHLKLAIAVVSARALEEKNLVKKV